MPKGIYQHKPHSEEHKRKIGESVRGFRHTDEAKLKISLAIKGKPKSERHKEILRQIRLGKKDSPETLKKRGEAIRINAQTNPNYGMKGKHHSKETKNKISNNMKGKPKPIGFGVGRIFSSEARKNLRISTLKYIESQSNGLPVSPRQGKYEKEILDKIEKQIGYPIKRQFYINGYYLDGYCQELNIAIEIDEEHHYDNNILGERDLERQNNIINSLHCEFIRIKVEDYLNNNSYFNFINVSELNNSAIPPSNELNGILASNKIL